MAPDQYRLAVHCLSEQQYPAAWTRRIHGRPDQTVAAHRQNHGVSAPAFR
jgi:hypothetical protein